MIPGITASRIKRASTPGGDPYWANVTLLMHFDGNITDVKGGAFNTAGTVGFAAGRFNQAMQLTSGDSGAVEPAARAAMDLPGDFTVEGWLQPTGSGVFINRFDVSTAGTGWQLELHSSGKLSFYQYAGGPSRPIGESGPNLLDGQWHHAAVTRQGSALRLFVDGVQVGTGTSSVDYTSSLARLSIGYQVQGNGRYPMRGLIDDVRITKGVARYTANFTPPAAEFPNS